MSAVPLQDAVGQALNEHGVPPDFKPVILDLMGKPDELWRFCCNRACQPCVKTLGAVVDRVKQLTGHFETEMG